MVCRKKTSRNRRKRNARTPWINIQKKISEKAAVAKVSPKNSSRTCPRCGCVVKTRVGRAYKCPKCGFELDRQKLASINIYLKYTKMRGFPHSSDPEREVKGELWAGVTPSGRSPVTWAPMKGVLRAVKPRAEGLIPSNIKPNETQTPVVQGIMRALLGI